MSHAPRPRMLRYLFFSLALLHGASAAFMIGDSDPRVQYTPAEMASNLCVSSDGPECQNRWWQQDLPSAYLGALRATAGPGSSLAVTFRGHTIAIIGMKDPRGASMIVSVDDSSPMRVSTDSNSDQELSQQSLFTQTGLDPTVDHILRVSYDPSSAGRRRRRLLRIDAFEVEDSTLGGETPTDNQEIPLPTPLPTYSDPGPDTDPRTSSPSSSTDPPDDIDDNAPVPSPKASNTVPIIAGVGTGLATLIIAVIAICLVLRRRRAVRVQSMEFGWNGGPVSPTTPQTRGVGGLVSYAFTRRGSSVGSSADRPHPAQPPAPTEPLPAVPPITTNFVSPYTYQRQVAYPRSDDTSDIGLPVDERPPNIPVSPVAQSPRVLKVYNPDRSTMVSSGHGH